jgi:Na+-transporting methylmalonyl-CoA/oxaloacetate decarboxylase gamma subunit
LENPIAAALIISVLGMPLLFLALAFFYGLLSLMTSAIGERQATPPARPVEAETVPGEDQVLLQAAALAVAFARAEAEQTSIPGPVGVEDEAVSQHVSPWWTLHHQRQLTSGRNPRRSQ